MEKQLLYQIKFIGLFLIIGYFSNINVNLFVGWKSRESVPKLVEEYLQKKLKLDEFISHTLPFEKLNEAFHLMHTGER